MGRPYSAFGVEVRQALDFKARWRWWWWMGRIHLTYHHHGSRRWWRRRRGEEVLRHSSSRPLATHSVSFAVDHGGWWWWGALGWWRWARVANRAAADLAWITGRLGARLLGTPAVVKAIARTSKHNKSVRKGRDKDAMPLLLRRLPLGAAYERLSLANLTAAAHHRLTTRILIAPSAGTHSE